MTKRRKRGVFDPDYRTKGWNKSSFAPKNSTLSITQFSLAIAFLLFLSLYFIPFTKPAMMTTTGLAAAGSGALIIWIALALLLKRREWRRIQRRIKPEEIVFDETEERAHAETLTGYSLKTKTNPMQQRPVDPIQAQLDSRRARLQGVIEPTAMTSRDFEHEVAWVLNTLTPYKAVPVGGAGDRGVDVKVYNGHHLIGIVQCKRYLTKGALAPLYVRELYAVKTQFKVKTAYLVTTSRFTPETQREADKLGIKLVDGAKWEDMRKRARALQRQIQQGELSGEI